MKAVRQCTCTCVRAHVYVVCVSERLHEGLAAALYARLGPRAVVGVSSAHLAAREVDDERRH